MPVDLHRPLVSQWTGPVIDAHCHMGTPQSTSRMIRAGRLYGVRKWMLICRIDEVEVARRRWGEEVGFLAWTEHKTVDDRQHLTERNLRIVEQATQAGCQGLKFWYKPEFNQRTGLFFDDASLDRVFEAAIDAQLPVLVHIADPDIWWRHRYHDRDLFERKRFTYRQLTNTLSRFPKLRVLAAHMGGWPENLGFMGQLLEEYPNLFLDTSGTKWIARELSHQPAAARAFMIRWSDRLLFGSDLVAFKHASFEHHCSRYWVHRYLYEQARIERSPIEDPDAGGPVYVAGLDLPETVLRRLYFENAVTLFDLDSQLPAASAEDSPVAGA